VHIWAAQRAAMKPFCLLVLPALLTAGLLAMLDEHHHGAAHGACHIND
jgi:hypothetical protein